MSAIARIITAPLIGDRGTSGSFGCRGIGPGGITAVIGPTAITSAGVFIDLQRGFAADRNLSGGGFRWLLQAIIMSKFLVIVLVTIQLCAIGCSRAPEAQSSAQPTPNIALKDQAARQQQAIANAAAQRQKEQAGNAARPHAAASPP